MKVARAGSALGFCLLVLGAKLWLIGAFGSPVPFWDQWGQEARQVYKPFVEGRWQPLDVFERANVHHIAWSRALAVGLLNANGMQWDPRVEMIVQGMLHAAFMTILAFAVARRLGRDALGVSLAVLGVFLVFPFGWGNTLWGYESHFYFLVFFSVLAILGLARSTPRDRAFWLGLAAAVAALYSAASGFLAGAAAAVAAAGAALTRRRSWRDAAPTVGLGLVLVAVGAWLTQYEGTVEASRFQNLRTDVGGGALARVATMLRAAGECLGWPLRRPGYAGWLLYAPLAVFGVLWLRDGRRDAPRGDPARERAETLLLALGAWAFLQAIGISALRGGEVANRHRDVLVFGVWANALALLLLLRSRVPAGALRFAQAGAALWIAVVAAGFGLAARATWREELPEWRSQTREQRENVLRFLATDDPAELADKPLFAIPHPNPDLLVELLRDPSVRGILPPVLRDPLALAPDAASSGWRLGQASPEAVKPSPDLQVVGSVPPGISRFRSEPLATRASALELAAAGGDLPSGGATLRLVDADGAALRSVALAPPAGGDWRPITIALTGGEGPVHLEVPALEGAAPDAWLALSAPKEVGPLGHRLVPLTAPPVAIGIALAGAALLGLGARAHRSS
jgi:hypothetical protein